MQENINIPDSNITSSLTFRNLVLMNMQQLTNFPYIEQDFDALTDYELLSLVVKYLDDVISNQNEQNTSITNLYNAFLSLQTYVNNTKDDVVQAFNDLNDYVRDYFANLDVQDEINNKLENMAQSGELTLLIKNYLDPYLLAQNTEINNFKTEINTKVNAQDNDIAVLSSRMDTFSQLTEGSTTGDAELEDIRVAYNGLIYDTAGNSVRGQVDEINETLNKTITYNRTYTEYDEDSEEVTVGNYYTNNSGGIVENANYKSISMQVQNKCYVYGDVNQTWIIVTVYNDSTFNSNSLVTRVYNPNNPTKENPLEVQAGNYVVVSINNLQNAPKIQVSEAYDVELNDIKINKSYNALAGIGITTNAWLSPTGGVGTDTGDTHPSCSDYFFTFNGDELKFNQRLSSSSSQFMWRICYYDKDKQFIAEESHQITGTVVGNYKNISYKMTNNNTNSVYARISYRTYNDPSINTAVDILFNYETLNDRLIYMTKETHDGISYNRSYPFDNLYPLSIAHRGDEGSAPENTLPAFRLAKSKGWDIIECDIRFTSDGVPILLHDYTINRTARNMDGSELSETIEIEDITYEQALSYSFGWYVGEIYKDVKICTVEEVLQLAKKIGLYIMFDCGNGKVATNNKFEEIHNLIKKYDMCDRVMFTAPSNGYILNFLYYYPKYYMCSNINAAYDTLGERVYANDLKTLYNRVGFTCPKETITNNTIVNCINQDIEVGTYLYTTEEEILNADQRLDLVTSSYYPYSKTLYDNNIGDPNTGLLD